MLTTILMFLLIAFFPRLMVLLVKKVSFLKMLGPVFLCYFAGILLSFPFKALGADITLASDFSSVLICIAMPLVLFSANLPALKKLARPMLISFAMNTAAVMIVSAAAFYILRGRVPDAVNISAMLIGTYTGGTPNMFAIGHGMGSPLERILLLQTADMIGGGIYLLMLLSILPRILKKILPEYRFTGGGDEEQTKLYAEQFSGEKQSVRPLRDFFSRAKTVLLSCACVVVAMGITLVIPSSYGNEGLAKLSEHTAIIMLIVTSLGIALSFVKRVRYAKGSYGSGQYFILMFSMVMGLCFDLSAISQALPVLGMLMLIQFGTVLVHILLAAAGRIDYHTMMITSAAGVFGPAFIIPVAKSLRNDEIVLPGILCGILGYAIGNYLGLGFGGLLNLLF